MRKKKRKSNKRSSKKSSRPTNKKEQYIVIALRNLYHKDNKFLKAGDEIKVSKSFYEFVKNNKNKNFQTKV